MDRRDVLATIAAMGTIGIAGCGAAVESEEIRVGADGDPVFDPAELTIETGTMIEFIWDSDDHNVAVTSKPTESDWEGVSEVQAADYEHEHTFMVDGQIEFQCDNHVDQGMQGVVIVEE